MAVNLKTGGNSVIRTFKSDVERLNKLKQCKKFNRRSIIMNTVTASGMGTTSALSIASDKPILAAISGGLTALFTGLTGAGIKLQRRLGKDIGNCVEKLSNDAKKEMSYMDVINRALRIKGKKEVTQEQVFKALNI